MYVSPIRNIEPKSQNLTFNAVNQKYYKWGKEYIDDIRTIPSELLHRIEFDVLVYKELSPQDGVDTLIALRDNLKPKKNQWANELIGNFKKLADKQRPQLKKFLKKVSQ